MVRKKRVIINPIYKDNTLDFIEEEVKEDLDRYVTKPRTNDRNQQTIDYDKTPEQVCKGEPKDILITVGGIALLTLIVYLFSI